MDAIYILMICAGGLFFILLFSYFIYAYFTKRRNMRKEQALRRVYADKNLAKMEYDVAVYDEETRKILDSGEGRHVSAEVQPAKNADKKSVEAENSLSESSEDGEEEDQSEVKFAKVDSEGMEEITGTFDGDRDESP